MKITDQEILIFLHHLQAIKSIQNNHKVFRLWKVQAHSIYIQIKAALHTEFYKLKMNKINKNSAKKH